MEGSLRHIANPFSERRNQLILDVLQEDTEDVKELDDDIDEVSAVYYGDETCNCSRSARCKSSKCICYLRGNKCTSACHSDSKSACTNK